MNCSFGCNQEAIKQFKSGSWCCSESSNSCPGFRRKNSNSHKNYIFTEEHKKKLRRKESIEVRKKKTRSLEKLKNKHPLFLEAEDVKEVDNILYVRCKNCDIFFVPFERQLECRIRSIEHPDGSKSFFFCSDFCKRTSFFYDKRERKNSDSDEFDKYCREAWRQTKISIKNFPDRIKSLHLRGTRNGYTLDHKFSVFKGFKQNIDPRIVGHYMNLEVIPSLINCNKRTKCSITIEELLQSIKSEKGI